MIALVLSLLAASDYAPAERQAYVVGAMSAVASTDAQKRSDLATYLQALERGACRSELPRLKVDCLMSAARRRCKGQRREAERCLLTADVIVTNALGASHWVPPSRRQELMRLNRDLRSALRAEATRLRAGLLLDFWSVQKPACAPDDFACFAPQIDAYCLESADTSDQSWQHCVAALAWFIATDGES